MEIPVSCEGIFILKKAQVTSQYQVYKSMMTYPNLTFDADVTCMGSKVKVY